MSHDAATSLQTVGQYIFVVGITLLLLGTLER